MADKKIDYIIVPENVLLCKKLPANAKLLYGYLIILCNDKGYCWASNQYFAELFNVSITSISLWITSLRKKGFITCKVYKNNRRKLFLKGVAKKLKGEEPLRKLKHIKEQQGQLESAVPAKDDFEIEEKEWVDKEGKKHKRVSIDYGEENQSQ